MRPSRFKDDQIRQAIAQVNSGTPLVAVCRNLGVTQTTFYRWRKKFGGQGPSAQHETRALRDENQKLKQLVADLSLERQLLRESLKKQLRVVTRQTPE